MKRYEKKITGYYEVGKFKWTDRLSTVIKDLPLQGNGNTTTAGIAVGNAAKNFKTVKSYNPESVSKKLNDCVLSANA